MGGDVEARVSCHQTQGSIFELRVTGNIGTSAVPIAIDYGQYLGTLRAASIWANVSSTDTVTRRIQNITTTSGAFTGTISCFTLDDPSTASQSGLLIAGQLDANVNITSSCVEAIQVANLAAGKAIKIAGSVTSPIIVTSAGGLDGQIVVNAGASTGGDWNGNLTVNGVSASGKHYTQTSFGDGSVGLVPYWVHGEECYPPAGYTIPTPSAVETLYYTFYGPVKYSGTGLPITISRTPIYFGENVSTDVTSTFAITVPGNGSRSVEIRAGEAGWIELGWKYKIEPTSSLLCDGLFTGTANTPVNGNSYSFNVEGPVVTGD